jgi:hypothetical protein
MPVLGCDAFPIPRSHHFSAKPAISWDFGRANQPALKKCTEYLKITSNERFRIYSCSIRPGYISGPIDPAGSAGDTPEIMFKCPALL